MRESVEKYPNSIASIKIIEYLGLLEQEDFRKTEIIKRYLDDN